MAEPAFYQRIMDDIRAKIASGEWGPGHRLPSTTNLTAHYAKLFRNPDLSPGTVRRAISDLLLLKELRGHQGLGVFVPGEEER